MAGRAGRQVQLFFGGNSPGDEIPGVREKGIEMNGEGIDVTSGEDAGWRQLLIIPSQNEVTVTLSGVTKSDRLKIAWNDSTGNYASRTQTVELVYPNGARFSGTFMMTSLKETEPYKDASTFETTLMSSGVITFTPGS
jgi:predicted secreted protein